MACVVKNGKKKKKKKKKKISGSDKSDRPPHSHGTNQAKYVRQFISKIHFVPILASWPLAL